ncbi:MAG: hypothetical protein A3D96_05470 [Chlamydiae bacterium RIFCSPHIGHO2_12_FULL_44_59]|nr:MAG: hypothetical protein A2796_02870 [Chlamydiae bacterium RIFCSPHIGHO2_01_FULL_44_39]OGN59072.1 MAG: hypothetical protein A3C42_01250 [Chlamydiae bacterium RIFCSPHIGHO2_02_FULL_45_9]OGN60262.1 MAG: hypothetical protein A3D96_05470 [Chlamydiae bacterium RIFCSPHIGHO2_12_FULL_44_59]OGN67085.1 MAG: hypothetical protein A2978_00575 [Chlamydiae bacterium RIFCSPLOWO2_01_FULL_44_52]OGN67675.1 MAG: hypothetical protein A3I67_04510 [Chlamydiae bacterium RIFCSPLOWO2_02_FULL_45_22]OGN71378.1 MAG: hyp
MNSKKKEKHFHKATTSTVYIFGTKLPKEAKSSLRNFTGRVYFTLPRKFIMLGAASSRQMSSKNVHSRGYVKLTFFRQE